MNSSVFFGSLPRLVSMSKGTIRKASRVGVAEVMLICVCLCVGIQIEGRMMLTEEEMLF